MRQLLAGSSLELIGRFTHPDLRLGALAVELLETLSDPAGAAPAAPLVVRQGRVPPPASDPVPTPLWRVPAGLVAELLGHLARDPDVPRATVAHWLAVCVGQHPDPDLAGDHALAPVWNDPAVIGALERDDLAVLLRTGSRAVRVWLLEQWAHHRADGRRGVAPPRPGG